MINREKTPQHEQYWEVHLININEMYFNIIGSLVKAFRVRAGIYGYLPPKVVSYLIKALGLKGV